MKHFDEHIIELFVLGSKEVAAQRGAFEAHLKECFSCRELYQEISDFHSLAGDTQPLLRGTEEKVEELSVVIDPQYIQRRPAVLRLVPMKVSARIRRFARKNPVTSSFTFVAVVLLMALALRYSLPVRDSNPNYVHHNEAKGLVEVFNREGGSLWNIVIGNRGMISGELLESGNLHTAVADLDEDGKNEVITMVPPENNSKNTLTIYDAAGNIILRKELGMPFAFNGEPYINQFLIRGIAVDDFERNGKKEIIVEMAHYHSPSLVQRLDGHGDVLGEYWHYGHFWGMKEITTQEGKKLLVLCGIDDKEERAVVSVLNPVNITGKTEATATRGFSLAASQAELYYIGFPQCDFDSLVEKPKPRVLDVYGETSNEIVFGISNAPRNRFFAFTFSKSFTVLEVNTDDGTRRMREKLLKEGKIHGEMNRAYFEKLKEGVEYWNGSSWEKNLAEVNHGIVAH